MNITIDASVWLAAESPAERESGTAVALIAALLARRAALHQPGLFIVEVCATIARRTRRRELALSAAQHALSTRGLVVHELNHRLAALAAEVAATCALRGADAVYVATALSARSTLVTLDRELCERAAAILEIRTPAELLSVVS